MAVINGVLVANWKQNWDEYKPKPEASVIYKGKVEKGLQELKAVFFLARQKQIM